MLDICGGSNEDHARDLKTGALLRVAVQLGACAAEAQSGQQRALRDYATRLSIALQIRDDTLDSQSPASDHVRAEHLAAFVATEVAQAFGHTEPATVLATLTIFSMARIY